jgi:hypothetical protein
MLLRKWSKRKGKKERMRVKKRDNLEIERKQSNKIRLILYLLRTKYGLDQKQPKKCKMMKMLISCLQKTQINLIENNNRSLNKN